jgi:hypothetical protein
MIGINGGLLNMYKLILKQACISSTCLNNDLVRNGGINNDTAISYSFGLLVIG